MFFYSRLSWLSHNIPDSCINTIKVDQRSCASLWFFLLWTEQWYYSTVPSNVNSELQYYHLMTHISNLKRYNVCRLIVDSSFNQLINRGYFLLSSKHFLFSSLTYNINALYFKFWHFKTIIVRFLSIPFGPMESKLLQVKMQQVLLG